MSLFKVIILVFSFHLISANSLLAKRCTGSSNCNACTNCSRCAYCSGGGTCGVCDGSSSHKRNSRNYGIMSTNQDEAFSKRYGTNRREKRKHNNGVIKHEDSISTPIPQSSSTDTNSDCSCSGWKTAFFILLIVLVISVLKRR